MESHVADVVRPHYRGMWGMQGAYVIGRGCGGKEGICTGERCAVRETGVHGGRARKGGAKEMGEHFILMQPRSMLCSHACSACYARMAVLRAPVWDGQLHRFLQKDRMLRVHVFCIHPPPHPPQHLAVLPCTCAMPDRPSPGLHRAIAEATTA
eukprot:10427365-Prorocentrum_lima.AAC.1